MTRKDLSPGDIFCHCSDARPAFMCLPGSREDGDPICMCILSGDSDRHAIGRVYGTNAGENVLPCVGDIEETVETTSCQMMSVGMLAVSQKLGEVVLKVGESPSSVGIFMSSSGFFHLLDHDSKFGIVKVDVRILSEESCAK